MSELTKELRPWYCDKPPDCDCHAMHDERVVELLDAHERLEAEHAAVSTDLEGVTMMLANTSFELRRLEEMLRAWGSPNLSVSVKGKQALWVEALRLAKERDRG